jgi:CubicO group peptidase (beta-lactamase class C family)
VLSKKAEEHIKYMLDGAIKNNELAGASVLILKQNTEIFYHQAGFAELDSKKPIQRDSLFRLYSLTKPVTAVATMMLMERGLIDLYDSVGNYLPGFRDQRVNENGDLVAPKRPMNIMDLLNMTSGLLYGGENLTGIKMNEFWGELDRRLFSDHPMTTLEAMNNLGSIPLAFHPGSSWEYGTSADVLGAIIEVVTGMKLGDYLREELFIPLGMIDTDFYVEGHKLDRLVTAYERVVDKSGASLIPYRGNHLGIMNCMDQKPAFESGGAGLVSTIDDYAKLAQMLMQKGTYKDVQILRPASVEYFTTKVLTKTQQKNFENWHTLAGHSYGNLMRIVTDARKAGTIVSQGEYGWDGWLGAYMSNCPSEEITLLFMMQMKDAGTTPTTRKLRNIVLSDLLAL